MKLVDKIKEQLLKRVKSFKVKGEIDRSLWAEVSITDNTGSPIWLGTQLDNTKFRAQSLTSEAIITEGTYRIDNNSHNPNLHQHVLGKVSPMPYEAKTISSALLMLLGSDYWKLEENLNRKEF